MNLNRRKLFGLMGGAAVAGPGIAKQAVAQLPQGLGLGIGPAPLWGEDPTSKGVDCGSISGRDWRLDEIATLKRLISGDLTAEEKEDRRRRKLHARHALISQEVASLMSVSGVRKLDIYNERVHRLEDDIRRSQHQSQLWRYLKEIGK
ncbi:hypothetical protein [Neorhizobium galegae]|uniref:hypothetical protein n=1 Tax=Neorhizobium galegae TaxID=399 RepID=UPI00210330A9|nr:hypothetical protein [Neorhizobium galegae]MCQ1850394.1 hypothetical protein [Neorhizobium galegae]